MPVFDPVVFTNADNIFIAPTARIDSFVKVEGGRGVTIGEHVHIASFAHINIGGGEVVIDARNRRFNNRRGVLFARQDLKAESAEFDNRAGSIATRGKLTLSTGEVNNEGGLLQALKSLDLDTHGQALYNLHSGKDQGVRAGTDLHIKAGALGNGAGVVVAGGQARLQVSSLDNQGGDIATGGGLRIEADSVDNRGGLLSSQGTLSVSDPASPRRLVIDNEGGRILAGGDLSLRPTP